MSLFTFLDTPVSRNRDSSRIVDRCLRSSVVLLGQIKQDCAVPVTLVGGIDWVSDDRMATASGYSDPLVCDS